MKNSLNDLNNHLFAQLERLSDEELKGDSLKEEIERSRAVTAVSRSIIENGRLQLDAIEIMRENKVDPTSAPDVLRIEKK
jgi:hypothetical protein